MYDLPPTHARNIARNETRVDAKGTSLNFRDKEFGTQFAIFRSRSLFKRLDIWMSLVWTLHIDRGLVAVLYPLQYRQIADQNPRKRFQKHRLEGYDDKGRTSKTLCMPEHVLISFSRSRKNHPSLSLYSLWRVLTNILCDSDWFQTNYQAVSARSFLEWYKVTEPKGAIALENNMSVLAYPCVWQSRSWKVNVDQ